MKYLGEYNVTKNKETVIITDEGEYPIWVKDAEKYFSGFEKGEEIEDSERLITLACNRYIKKKAIRRLAAGDITKKALITKLCREKAFGAYPDRAWVEELIGKLERAGYLDDKGYAKRYAEKCLEKLWGEVKVKGSMYEKGFERETVDEALESLDPDFVSLAKDYIKKNLDGQEKDVIWRKLSSRGFLSDTISSALSGMQN